MSLILRFAPPFHCSSPSITIFHLCRMCVGVWCVLLPLQWLCSSLQSLSSAMSSMDSLGAPSTLKLPLWDKASAEFCFAKSRELLTKPSAWSSYCDVDYDPRLMDKVKIKSTEFLENGNQFPFPNGHRRVSASYADKYSFDHHQRLYSNGNNHHDQQYDYDSDKTISENFDPPTNSKKKQQPQKQPNGVMLAELAKKLDMQKLRLASICGSSDSLKTRTQGMPGSPRNNSAENRRQMINIRETKKLERKQNGFAKFPYTISSNPLFIADPSASPVHSGPECEQRVSFRNFVRRKSDADAHNAKKSLSDPKKSLPLNLLHRPKKPQTLHLDLNGTNPFLRDVVARDEIAKTEILINKINRETNPFRQRTGSFSEQTRRAHIKNLRRSFHPGDDSSEDSDSISHSETDLRGRFRMKRRHKRMQQLKGCYGLKNGGSPFLRINAMTENSSPPSVNSFLNSLASPPIPIRNNLLQTTITTTSTTTASWQESAPTSSLTFTSNSDTESTESSSEYHELNNDNHPACPPSPAP